VGLSGAWSGKSVAFRNPDNSLVIVINNPFKDPRDLYLAYEGQTLKFELEADSFNSIVISEG
jgi:glucosylceramidase